MPDADAGRKAAGGPNASGTFFHFWLHYCTDSVPSLGPIGSSQITKAGTMQDESRVLAELR
jgi:uncharacterized protein CbrC (UPF0167 family)